MDNLQRYSPASPEIRRHPLTAKHFLTERSYPWWDAIPKTTTNSMNCSALLSTILFPYGVLLPGSGSPSRSGRGWLSRAGRTMMDEQHPCTHAIESPAPESKVARRAQFCAFHWVQGSPLPPAAQAIILSQRLRRLSDYLDSVRLVSYTFNTENLEERCRFFAFQSRARAILNPLELKHN
jgi:hypothetical protein